MTDRIVRGYVVQIEDGRYLDEHGWPYSQARIPLEEAFAYPEDKLAKILSRIGDWTYKPLNLIPVTRTISEQPIDISGLSPLQALDLIEYEGGPQ